VAYEDLHAKCAQPSVALAAAKGVSSEALRRDGGIEWPRSPFDDPPMFIGSPAMNLINDKLRRAGASAVVETVGSVHLFGQKSGSRNPDMEGMWQSRSKRI
jgi:hypothetical protein